MLCLGKFHCFLLCLLIHSISSSQLLNLSSVYFSSAIVIFSFVTSFWYFLMFSFCWSSQCIYSLFSWAQWEWVSWWHFEFLLSYAVYLHIIKVFFWGFVLFSYFLEHFSLFSHFVDCFHFHVLGEMATSISLIEMAIFRCWPFLSYLAIALGCLLNPCDYLNCLIYFFFRVCQDLSLS